jgi:hypothetical protein
MSKLKIIVLLFAVAFALTSCSLVDKLKEKLSSNKESNEKNEETKKEDTKISSASDLQFYNKYIDVSNKIQEAGDKVYKDFNSDIPSAASISKSSFVIAVSFKLSADNLERVIKEYKRSYFDGGELSKLNASEEMKTEVESSFKELIKVLEDYQAVASKVSDYYSKGDYKEDLSKAGGYEENMQAAYEKYKSAFSKFSDAVKKNKPKREKRDPNSVSNPDERAVLVLMNSYENTLDKAEQFYDAFNGVEYKGDYSKAKEKFREFESSFKDDKNSVLSAEFTDKTKYMKYSYEDYFVKMTNMFLDAGNKFFDHAPSAKDINDFNRTYDDVVNNYNYMITAYNTNINIVNTFQSY